MYPIIPSCFFKTLRTNQAKTLKEVSVDTNIELSYINKLENGIIKPNPRIIKRLLKYYHIDQNEYEYCEFTEEQIKSWLKKLYYVEYTEQDDETIRNLLQRHSNSIYNYYLRLILWCRKSLRNQFDESFIKELALLNCGENVLIDDLRSFFLICKMNYFTRIGQKKQSKQVINLFKDVQDNSWPGLKEYFQINYELLYTSLINVPGLIMICKKEFEKTGNVKRLRNLKMVEGQFYYKLKNYDDAIEIYEQVAKEFLENEHVGNYAITHCNIAWLYNVQKNYEKAIVHYLKSIEYRQNNLVFFDLAWCYYSIHNYEACLETIKRAETSYEVSKPHTVFLNWLKAMIEKPYSNKALGLLIQIKNDCIHELSNEMKLFLNMALANHYSEIKDFESAARYYKEVIASEVSTNITC